MEYLESLINYGLLSIVAREGVLGIVKGARYVLPNRQTLITLAEKRATLERLATVRFAEEDRLVFHPTNVVQRLLSEDRWYVFMFAGHALEGQVVVQKLTGVEPMEVTTNWEVLRLLRDGEVVFVTNFGIREDFGPRPVERVKEDGPLGAFDVGRGVCGPARLPCRGAVEIPSRDGQGVLRVPRRVKSTREDGLIGHCMLGVGVLGDLILMETLWRGDRWRVVSCAYARECRARFWSLPEVKWRCAADLTPLVAKSVDWMGSGCEDAFPEGECCCCLSAEEANV
jgi:hypothetical protein